MTSRAARWRRFVEVRRAELIDVSPGALPSRRRTCPKHFGQLGPVSRMCWTCHEEMLERLASEYHALFMAAPGRVDQGRQEDGTTERRTA